MSTKPAHTAFLNLNDISEELYSSIKDAAYAHAVEVTKNISANGHKVIISDVVARLAQENNRNLLSYVYSLWVGGERNIVSDQMPKTFKSIFSEEDVILQSKKYGLALKLEVYIDSGGDKKAFGDSSDKTGHRVVWKILPVWENNRVHFRLKNIDCNMILKLELIEDSIGDRGAFGTTVSEGIRDTWILEPVMIDGEVLFYIINRQFSQGLKLGVDVDRDNDRILWGHNGDLKSDPRRFAWYIKKHNSAINDEL